jgi:hypothetical protein
MRCSCWNLLRRPLPLRQPLDWHMRTFAVCFLARVRCRAVVADSYTECPCISATFSQGQRASKDNAHHGRGGRSAEAHSYACRRHTSSSAAVNLLFPLNCAWPLPARHTAMIVQASPSSGNLSSTSSYTRGKSMRPVLMSPLTCSGVSSGAAARGMAAACLEVTRAKYRAECTTAV